MMEITLTNGETISREDYIHRKSAELLAEGFVFADEAEVRDQLIRVLDNAGNGLSLAGMYIRDEVVLPVKL